MNTDHKKINLQKITSLLILALGIVLLAFMIIVEDEPGAVPLFMILLGGGGYFYTRFKRRSIKKEL